VKNQLVLQKPSVCSLVIQYAMRMRRIVLYSLASLALPYFPHYPIHGTNFGKKLIGNRMWATILSTTFAQSISHYKKNSARYHICTYVFFKVPVILVRF